MNNFILLVGLVIFISACGPENQFVHLSCNYQEGEIAYLDDSPNFSWIVSSDQHGNYQSGYQVFVASSQEFLSNNQPNLWDSGKRSSDSTLNIPYQGLKMDSNQSYYWKVRVWDRKGQMVESPVREIQMGLDEKDWQADWISAGPAREPFLPKGFLMQVSDQMDLEDTIVHQGRSLLLRHDFTAQPKILSARVNVTGLGFYELFINGNRVGNKVLNPAKTNYNQQVLYDSYEVTGLIREGKNAIGIHLGNGWFNPYKKWWKEYRMQWFGAKRAILQMELTYEDGSSELVTTSEEWKAYPGPVLYNCIYDGEVFDGREVLDEWSMPGFEDTNWQAAIKMDSPSGKLELQKMPPILVVEQRKPVSVDSFPGSRLVYDFGQNATGWVKITLQGKPGTKINFHFAEDVHEDGSLDPSSNERAKAMATYILRGEDIETYEPKFTYFGFQYLEISCDGEMPRILSITAPVVHSDNKATGTFECSNDLVNKIHHATNWSQKSNMVGYPMDCPQRDERLGWMGDVQVTAEEAMFNFDMSAFFANWLTGIRLNQDPGTGDIPIISPRPYIKDEGVGWSSTYIILVWQHYLYYGNQAVLSEHYPAMQKYLLFLDSLSDELIVPPGWIGDWGSLVEGWHEGEPVSVPTAFYYYNSEIMARIAGILEKPAERDHYHQLAAQIKQQYQVKFFHPVTANYNDGSQMANGFPLFLGLVPEKHKNAVLNNLVGDIQKKHDTHLTTGVLGTKYMIEALTAEGRPDIAWNLVNQKTSPSWFEMMKKYNTMCEFWTLKQSKNHVMMGSIDAWFYKYLAGIQLDPDQPAFKHFYLSPWFPEDLDKASASIQTVRGTIKMNWERTSKGFVAEFEVPFNTSATMILPVPSSASLRINNEPVSELAVVSNFSRQENQQQFKIAAGNYRLEIDL